MCRTQNMRIAVGQLWQETNTFNRHPTTLVDFENWGVALGRDVIDRYGGAGELSGFLAAARQWRPDAEFVGLARFACWPWGAVDGAAWQHIRSTFAEQLEAAGPVDAVFLALHGAMAADGEPDVTGAILAQVRRAVGERVAIAGSLDLHANITRRMLAAADVLCGYHTCPHLDSVETGARAARALRAIIDDNARPVTIWRKLPMITAAESHNTFTGPPAPLYRRLVELERQPEVLSAGLYMAMPWFDAPGLGWTITLTVAAGGPPAASAGSPSALPVAAHLSAELDDLAQACWHLRTTMEAVERHPPAAIVERALAVLATGRHPVVIGDGADATNSGAPGDSTHLLREFLARESIPHGALTFLVDPAAVALAWNLGEGSTFGAPIGGAFAPEYSQPIRFQGTVERLVTIEFILDGHISRNLPVRMGRGAVVRSPSRTAAGDLNAASSRDSESRAQSGRRQAACGHGDAVTVLLVEQTGPGSTPRLYEAAGLDPRAFGIVVAKSPAGFRADYEPFAAEILLADCPGCASPDWRQLSFHRANRPLWPLDALDDLQSASWCESSTATASSLPAGRSTTT